jgi:hypothetical protein
MAVELLRSRRLRGVAGLGNGWVGSEAWIGTEMRGTDQTCVLTFSFASFL